MAPRIQVKVEPLRLHLKDPFTISRSSSTTKDNVLVRLEWGDYVGLGEASYTPRYGQEAADVLLALERAASVLDGVTTGPEELSTRVDALGLPSGARMGLTMAIADLGATAKGQALHTWLGLPPPPLTPTSFTIGIDSPDAMARKARAAHAFKILKVKAGTEGDMERIRAVRSVHGGVMRVDANEGWTEAQAPRRLRALAEMNVEFVEQPLPAGRLEALAALRRGSPLPLVADEDVLGPGHLERLVGCVDGINVKLMKCGGLDRAVLLINEARTLGLRVMIGCMIESSLAITAASHLLGLADYADLDGHMLIADDPFSGVKLQDGALLVPVDRPGVGAQWVGSGR